MDLTTLYGVLYSPPRKLVEIPEFKVRYLSSGGTPGMNALGTGLIFDEMRRSGGILMELARST